MDFETFRQQLTELQPSDKGSVERVKEAESFFQQALEISLQAQKSDLANTEATFQATDYFIKCLFLNPHHIRAYLNLALILLAQGDFDSAKSYLNEALKIAPDHKEALSLKQVLADMYATGEEKPSEDIALSEDELSEQVSELRQKITAELRRVEAKIAAVRAGVFESGQDSSDFEAISEFFKDVKRHLSREVLVSLTRDYHKLLAHIQLLNFIKSAKES